MEDNVTPQFSIFDYIVVAVMLFISLAIGLYYAYKGKPEGESSTDEEDSNEESSREYFLAGGGMGVIPAAFSLLASALDSIWYMGIPAEFYFYGFHFWGDLVSIPLVIFLVAYGVMPIFHDLGATSANEYLEKRFNTKMRKFASIIFILNTVLYVSIVMYIPAMSLSKVTGIHIWISISVMCLIGTIYTAVGGIRAVMWTDVFQMIIIYVSMVAIIIMGSIELGGIETVLKDAVEGNRLAWPPMDPDPRYRYNFALILISAFIYWMLLFSTSQTQVQRYMTCPTKKKAIKALAINVPAFLLVEILVLLIGLIMYSTFKNCDPLLSNEIDQNDELLPYYVMHVFRNAPGLPGLFVAGVFSGALSTVSSCLNSMAAVTTEDLVMVIPKFQKMKQKSKMALSRAIALFYGFITLPVMLLAERVQSIVVFLAYNNGLLSGSLGAVFFLGFFVPWSNTVGTTLGLIVGGGIGAALVVGSQIVNVDFQAQIQSVEGCANKTFIQPSNYTPLYRIPVEGSEFMEIFTISPYWAQVVVVVLVMLFGMIFSAIYNCFQESQEVEPQLLSPFVNKFMKKDQVNITSVDASDQVDGSTQGGRAKLRDSAYLKKITDLPDETFF